MSKRLVALLMTALLLAGSLSIPALAEEPYVYHAAVACNTLSKDFNEFTWLQELEDAAGIDIVYDCYWTDWGTIKSNMFASGDVPDLFFDGDTISVNDIMNNIDYFVPLNDYIENSVNLKKLYEEDPYMKGFTQLPDGTIYSVCNRLPCRPVTSAGLYINKTWLDKLGKAVPTTLDELYDVLVAMKEGDPNGNGINDEIPWAGAATATDWLMGSWGVAASNYHLMMDGEGKLNYVYTTEAYRKAIEFEAKCFAAGVIDPEIFTNDQMYALSQQQPEVVGLNAAWTITAVNGPINAKDYVTVAPMKASADSEIEPVWYGHPATMVYCCDAVFAMTINCPKEHRQALFNFIDSLYTNENTMRQWGGEGVIFNEDGTCDVTVPESCAGMSLDDYQWTWAYNARSVGYVSAEYESTKINKHPEQMEKLDIDAIYKDKVTPAIPIVILSEDDSTERSTLITDMENVRKQWRSDWITGVKEVNDETWNQYITEMTNAGYQRYEEIYQNAIAK